MFPEKESPIANAGLDIVVQPKEWVSLNGLESKAKDGKVISKFEWSLQKGDSSVVIQVRASYMVIIISIHSVLS